MRRDTYGLSSGMSGLKEKKMGVVKKHTFDVIVHSDVPDFENITVTTFGDVTETLALACINENGTEKL